MAKNKEAGKGRVGAVKDRTQFKTKSGHWAKRDTSTGKILNVKSDSSPFKGVTKEKKD